MLRLLCRIKTGGIVAVRRGSNIIKTLLAGADGRLNASPGRADCLVKLFMFIRRNTPFSRVRTSALPRRARPDGSDGLTIIPVKTCFALNQTMLDSTITMRYYITKQVIIDA